MSRDDVTPRSDRLARWLAAFWRALPWLVPLAIILAVLAASLFPLPAVRDAVSFEVIDEAVFRKPAAYILLSPLSELLDVVTLLSARQHVALLLTLAVTYVLWWWWRGGFVPHTVPATRKTVRVVARLGLALLVPLTLYLAAILLPRPMASLDPGPDLLAVDFHSHTSFSHDGRPDWTPEDNRNWHRDAGYGAAFVTDHRTFDGARAAWPNNPTYAGGGTSLLPAVEVVWHGEHVNVLDADRMYRGILTPTLADVDEEALTLASAVPGNEPVLIHTLPGNLDSVRAARGTATAGVRAIEIVDGSPRGLGQTRRERARIIAIADSLNLALVSGSDHHGWGHTAAGWTLMYLKNWRAVRPVAVTSAIAFNIRRGGRGATRVAERYVANTDRWERLPFTVPVVLWQLLRTLTSDERVVWIAWTIAIALLAEWLRLRRARVAGVIDA